MRYFTSAMSFVLVCFLVACSVSAPVVVKTSKGETLLGSALATMSAGTFEVMNEDGLKCNGTYDQMSAAIMLEIQIKCSDGRHGKAVIQRDRTMVNGVGQGKLNDGTKFKVLFGNYAMQM